MSKILAEARDLEKIKSDVKNFVFKADYKSAVKYLQKWKKIYPDNLYIQAALATLPFEEDFAHTGARRDRAFKKAAANLKPLLRRMRGLPLDERFRNRNEYYWFSQQHKKQYLLGVEGVKVGRVRSYYSQGVGASNLAYKLVLKKPASKEGQRWAKVAERAWLKYFKLWNDKYHDAWKWYALSLGLQGRNDEMEKALKRSAKLAGVSDRKDPHLNEIREMVKRCQKN